MAENTVRMVAYVKKGYKVVLSTGPAIPCDPDEIQPILRAINTGNSIKLRRGIFNPSFYVSIVEDEERKMKFLEDTRHNPQRRALGMEALRDIFDDMPQLKAAKAGGYQRIGDGTDGERA